MDDSIYSIVLLLIICAAIYLVITGRSSHTSKRIGETGEFNIISIIERCLRKGLYGYVLHNLYVPKVDGGSSEVDVVLVCTKGIFVFESKNYAGWIFGDDEHKYWTVTLYAGKDWIGFKQTEKHKFYNPIWQNNSHIRNLKKVLGNTVPMISIVVFSDRCELKNIVNYSDTNIMQTSYLKHYLSDVRNIYDDILTIDEVDNIYNRLLSFTDIDGEKQQRHLAYVNEQQFNPTRCPRCGGQLVIRTAKKGSNTGGQFYGCSNYPKCKYTRNIE